MASSGFVADFGRRPVAVKLGVLALVLVLLGAAWYMLFYAKVLKDIEAAKQQAADLNNRKAQLAKDEVRYTELDEQQKRLKQLIAENDNALPTAAQLPAFFDMLNRKVGEAGVQVRKWEYQKEVPVEETIYKVPVGIELTGSYYQIEKFFYLLYKVNQKEGDEGTPPPGAPVDTNEKDRILTIEDLHIFEPVVENGELVLTAAFRASTFRKEELAPAPAEDDKTKKKAASGKGTIDKVKAKTEDAMKKDEERSGADKVKGGM